MGSLTRLGCEQGWSSLSLSQVVVSQSRWAPLVPLIWPQVVSELLLPWLATVQIHPLELREGHGGWSLACKKWWTKGGLCAQPHLVSVPGSPSEPHSVSNSGLKVLKLKRCYSKYSLYIDIPIVYGDATSSQAQCQAFWALVKRSNSDL